MIFSALYQMFWFDIAPVGSSSIENHRKSKQLDDFIPFGVFDAKGFGMSFDLSVSRPQPISPSFCYQRLSFRLQESYRCFWTTGLL